MLNVIEFLVSTNYLVYIKKNLKFLLLSWGGGLKAVVDMSAKNFSFLSGRFPLKFIDCVGKGIFSMNNDTKLRSTIQ